MPKPLAHPVLLLRFEIILNQIWDLKAAFGIEKDIMLSFSEVRSQALSSARRCTRARNFLYIHIHELCIHTYICIYIYGHVFMHICMCTYICRYVCIHETGRRPLSSKLGIHKTVKASLRPWLPGRSLWPRPSCYLLPRQRIHPGENSLV